MILLLNLALIQNSTVDLINVRKNQEFLELTAQVNSEEDSEE